MSVCVAWKFENKICVAADSRFVGGNLPIDCGIKVLECPIEIIGPIKAKTGTYDTWHQSAVGLAFCGTHLAGYLVKERIAELFLKLQSVDADITFEKIAQAAFKMYEHGITVLNAAYGGYGHSTDFFLVGRCPSTAEQVAYRFSCNEDSGKCEAARVLTGGGFAFEAIGAGSERIRERIDARLKGGGCAVHFMVLEEIRQMILLNEVASVGGTIQYGEIEGNNPFRIYGVSDFRMKGTAPIPTPSSRGIDLDVMLHPEGAHDLHVRESMIAPFRGLLDREVELARKSENRDRT